MDLPTLGPGPHANPLASSKPLAPGPVQEEKLRTAAVALEASFLAEMLKSVGVGKMPETFGGGPGEDQFTTLLVREQAKMLAENGGIGLAESLFQALKDRAGYVD